MFGLPPVCAHCASGVDRRPSRLSRVTSPLNCLVPAAANRGSKRCSMRIGTLGVDGVFRMLGVFGAAHPPGSLDHRGEVQTAPVEPGQITGRAHRSASFARIAV